MGATFLQRRVATRLYKKYAAPIAAQGEASPCQSKQKTETKKPFLKSRRLQERAMRSRERLSL